MEASACSCATWGSARQARVRELQALLRRAGTYRGPQDGEYGDATRRAFREWVGVENLEERWWGDARVDPVVLDFLRRRYGAQEG